jgi:RNA polymerase sigma factor (sigma-70 family)
MNNPENRLSDASPMKAPDSAVTELVARMRPRLLRIAMRHAISPPDFEDLLQDALVALLMQWPTIRDPAAWLVGTIWHRCQYHRRQQRIRGTAVDPEHLELLAGASPEQQALQDWRMDLKHLSRALPPRQRRLLRLVYDRGLTEDEAADHLGISKPALHQDRWRAIAQLRRLLQLRPTPSSSTSGRRR